MGPPPAFSRRHGDRNWAEAGRKDRSLDFRVFLGRGAFVGRHDAGLCCTWLGLSEPEEAFLGAPQIRLQSTINFFLVFTAEAGSVFFQGWHQLPLPLPAHSHAHQDRMRDLASEGPFAWGCFS